MELSVDGKVYLYEIRCLPNVKIPRMVKSSHEIPITNRVFRPGVREIRPSDGAKQWLTSLFVAVSDILPSGIFYPQGGCSFSYFSVSLSL